MLKIKNVATQNCIDTLGRRIGENAGTFTCHKQGGNQAFAFTKSKQIISSGHMCLSFDGEENVVSLGTCDKNVIDQEWSYDENVFY